jgi:dTDP-4-dehydrorhamnose 3,5-epimerase
VIFEELAIAGAFRLKPERHTDERGSFARIWCARELAEHGMDARIAQSSLSMNTQRGTLRGMHYSVAPHPETKIVRCVRGSIYDVLIDLRPGSATFGRWVAETLTAENAAALYIPAGVAHGFQTLRDDSDVLYQMNEFYYPECARGVRWDDPAFGVEWPAADRILSERDRSYPDFRPEVGA